MRILFFVATLAILSSCEGGRKTLIGYTGNPGEVIVVASKKYWNGEAGVALKEIMLKPDDALPQPEPRFKLVNFAPASFSSIIERHRNIIYFQINDTIKENKLDFQKSVWSKNQLVTYIKAKNQKEAKKLLQRNAELLSKTYDAIELDRLARKNKKFGSKELNKQIKKQHAFELTTQKDMYIAKSEGDIIWLRLERERPIGGFQHQITQGILIEHKPYQVGVEFNDSIFTKWMQESLAKNIPGPIDSSYMQLSMDYVKPVVEAVDFRGNYALEAHGLWGMKNYSMGGPFVAMMVLDKAANRAILIYGYVYAPQFKKMAYRREVEAIIKSLKLG